MVLSITNLVTVGYRTVRTDFDVMVDSQTSICMSRRDALKVRSVAILFAEDGAKGYHVHIRENVKWVSKFHRFLAFPGLKVSYQFLNF